MDGLVPTSVSIVYNAAGTFTVMVNDLRADPDDGICTVSLTKYNGQIVSVAIPCDVSHEFTLAQSGVGSFGYGTEYTFIVAFVDGNSPCETVTTYVPPVCSNALGASTQLSLVKDEMGKVKAFLSQRPTTGLCVFHLTKWNGANPGVSTNSGLIDCSLPAVLDEDNVPMVLGQSVSADMASFALPNADIATDQPICGAGTVSIVPTECVVDESVLTLIDRGVLNMDIGISDTAYKCVVSLVTWAGIDVQSKLIQRQSADCSTVFFNFRDVSELPGAGIYTVEVAKFNSADNVDFTNPICSIIKEVTMTTHACPGGNIAVARPDPNSIQVSLTAKPMYGLCQVELLSYEGSTAGIIQLGPCDGNFNFAYGESGIEFTESASYELQYMYFEGSDYSVLPPTCTSGVTSSSISPYSCDASPIHGRLISPGRYTFSISNLIPLTGSCSLRMEDEEARVAYIPFPGGCASSVTVTYTEIEAAFDSAFANVGISAGDMIIFTYRHTSVVGGMTCDSTGASFDDRIRVKVSIEQLGPIVPGSITVDAVDEPLRPGIQIGDGYENPYCVVYLVGCDGTTGAAALEPLSDGISHTECTGINPYTFIDGINPDSICQFELKVWPNLDEYTADLTKALYGGYSGLVTLPSGDAPAWADDDSQEITVSLYGDDCLTVSWPVPASTGGAPISCYQVTRFDETSVTGRRIISSCDTALPSQSLSVVTCTFSDVVEFRVIARNRFGATDDLVLSDIDIDDLKMSSVATLTSPNPATADFVAGSFPVITVQSDSDTTSTNKLFVGRLVNECTGLAMNGVLPVSATTDGLVNGPLGRNSAPAFTKTFISIGAGVYQLTALVQPAAGDYSLLTYILEAGGLFGQYYTNPYLFLDAEIDRKDPVLNFNWGLGSIIIGNNRVSDLVSIRWTGFIEAQYAEVYTITTVTNDYVRVWIDDVLLVNKWDVACGGSCGEQVELTLSTSNSPKFHHIRIEYYHKRGPASFGLYWSSDSQPYQVIPSNRLYKGAIIDNEVDEIPTPCRFMDIEPDVLSIPDSIASHSLTAVAGISFDVYITAKDQYNNTLESQDSTFTVRLGATETYFSSIPLDDGLYYVPVVITEAGPTTLTIYSGAIEDEVLGSGNDVVVSPGPAYIVLAPTLPVELVAGEPFTFDIEVQDEYGNAVTGDPEPDIYANAAWTGDAATAGLMTDIQSREDRYGIFFIETSVAWNQVDAYTVTVMLPFRGEYDAVMGIYGSLGASVDDTWNVVPSPSPSSLFSIVTTEGFPPSELIVGVSQDITVQLRDEYINSYTSTPDTAHTVTVKLAQHTGTSCTDEENGTYLCQVNPIISGTDFFLSILVDGGQVSYLYDDGDIVRRMRGPWAVDVSPGSVSFDDSIVVGIRTVYRVDETQSFTIVLRDSLENLIGEAVEGIELTVISVTIDDVEVLDSIDFNQDGTLTVYIVPTQVLTGVDLVIVMDAISLTPTWGPVRVVNGPVSAAGSTCAPLGDIEAGEDLYIACTMKDAYGNTLEDMSDLHVATSFRHMTDGSVDDFDEPLSYDAIGDIYEETINSLTRVGDYTFYTILGQPGGLVGQYYSGDAFNELINDPMITEDRFVDGDQFAYTRIDSVVDFSIGSSLMVGGSSVGSVRWSGLWYPSGPPSIMGNYPLRISANGGISVTIDGLHLVDMLGETVVDKHPFQFSGLITIPVSIEILYIPQGVSALVQFRRAVDPDAVTPLYTTVPPSNLHAALRVPHSPDNGYIMTVSIGPVSTQSTATLAASYPQGSPDTFTIQPSDEFNNPWTTDCFLEIPACGFQISLVNDEGDEVVDVNTLGATVEHFADGVLMVSIEFPTDGPVYVKIEHQVGIDWFELAASPYQTEVIPV